MPRIHLKQTANRSSVGIYTVAIVAVSILLALAAFAVLLFTPTEKLPFRALVLPGKSNQPDPTISTKQLEQQLQTASETHGELSVETAEALVALAKQQARNRAFDAAEESYIRAHDIYLKTRPDSDSERIGVMAALTALYASQGKFSRAQVLQSKLKKLSFRSVEKVGHAYVAHDYPLLEVACREQLQILNALPDTTADMTANPRYLLGAACREQGKLPEAAEILQSLVDDARKDSRKGWTPLKVQALGAADVLARTYELIGRRDLAESLYKQAIIDHDDYSGERHTKFRRRYAEFLQRCNRYAEASELRAENKSIRDDQEDISSASGNK